MDLEFEQRIKLHGKGNFTNRRMLEARQSRPDGACGLWCGDAHVPQPCKTVSRMGSASRWLDITSEEEEERWADAPRLVPRCRAQKSAAKCCELSTLPRHRVNFDKPAVHMDPPKRLMGQTAVG